MATISISDLMRQNPIAPVAGKTAEQVEAERQRQMSERTSVKNAIRNKLQIDAGVTITRLADLLLSYYQKILDEKFLNLNLVKVQPKVAQLADWLYNATQTGLYICGGVGSGKTTLVKSLARLVGTYNFSQTSSHAIDLKFHCAVNNSKFTEDKGLLDKLCNCQMLVLDDLGAEHSVVIKDYGNEINPYSEIISKRYDLNLPTIITSNLNLSDLCARYTRTELDRLRLFDRMSEQYKVDVITTPESLRQVNREAQAVQQTLFQPQF